MVSPAKKKRRRRDRLSDLQDDILGHVLSFLPTEEAGRAAVLSRRWRRVFDIVQTISFQPVEPPAMDVFGEHRRLVDRVTNALVARRRCDGDAPLRCLRVAMRGYTAPDCYAVDQWLSYARNHGIQDLRLETATHVHAYTGTSAHCCVDGYDDSNGNDGSDGYDDSDGNHGYDDSDGNDGYDDSDGYDSRDYSDYESTSGSESDSDTVTSDGITGVPQYAAPTRLQYDVSPEIFSCATMRALHLVSCLLPPRQLPSTIHLPSLETLSLTNIAYTNRQISGENMQRVISCCPRLADLTLEACGQITDITVLDKKRLTSFALRCCHSVRRVTIDGASETLRAFDYRGDASSCFTLVGGALRIASAKIHVCSSGKKKIDFERLRGFLVLFVNATHLQLSWPDVTDNALSSDYYDDFHACLDFPRFHNLTRLELGSRCTDRRVVDRVAGVLRQTPNLTVLVIKLESCAVANNRNYGNVLDVPVPPPCLRDRVREMSVEQYQGGKLQKMLLEWLLRGALMLESVRVVFKGGRRRYSMMNDIKSWAQIPATSITFS